VRGLRVSRAARRDLVEIGRFTLERWGEDQCRRYLAQLDGRMRELARDPEQGRRCDELKPGYWRCAEARHVIFYRVSSKSVDVIRVLHERMLPKQRL
jgi:toxin ParE1/3/4